MEPTPLKDLNSAETKELSELLLLQHDVQTSMEAMRLWTAKQGAESPDDLIIAGALFRDAIVQFMGCFDSSAPFKLSSDTIYSNVDGANEYFQWLKDLRDAYAAHKFGRARQAITGIIQSPDGSPGVGQMTMIYQGPQEAKAGTEIAAFMSICLKHINSRIETLRAAITTIATKMSAAEIAALPTARLYGVDPDQLRKGRRR
jgi:hypothetical protein